MLRRSAAVFLGMGALSIALVGASLGGCQSNNPGTGGGGSTSTGTTSTEPSTSSSSGSTTTDTTTGGGMGGGGTGGNGGAGGGAMSATIHDITTGVIGPKVPVQVNGVVVTSQKFLVSQSKSTGSCLWGVFVSAPGLTEAAANSGILALSYGTPASIPDGGTKAFCPIAGKDDTGDGFGDVAPGDVIDISGKTDYFKSTSCGMTAGDTTVAQYQISNVTKVVKHGTAAVPAPHVFTDADVAQWTQTNMTFFNQWGGTKVRLQNVTSVPQTNGDGGTGITDQYGHIVLMGSNIQVGDKIYYQGLLAKTDVCHKGPTYANSATTFSDVDGFVYLDFCTWSLEPGNRCADLNPASDDCTGTTCP